MHYKLVFNYDILDKLWLVRKIDELKKKDENNNLDTYM
jgi:hypothetical protein